MRVHHPRPLRQPSGCFIAAPPGPRGGGVSKCARSPTDRLPGPRARTEGVHFARASLNFTRDFEDLVGWLATTMDKTAMRRLVRIGWDTTGRIIERVMQTGLDPRASTTSSSSARTR